MRRWQIIYTTQCVGWMFISLGGNYLLHNALEEPPQKEGVRTPWKGWDVAKQRQKDTIRYLDGRLSQKLNPSFLFRFRWYLVQVTSHCCFVDMLLYLSGIALLQW